MTTQHTGEALKTTRRTLVKGAAWSVPVVAMGSAAPAMAASPVVTVANQTACKHSNEPPSNQRYHFDLIFTNTSNTDTKFRITSITMSPNSGSPVTFTPGSYVPAPGTEFPVSGNSFVSVVIDSDPTQNQANGSLVVNYEYFENGAWVPATQPLTSPDMPPCQGSQGGVPNLPHLTYNPGNRVFP